MSRELSYCEQVERSISRKYRKEIWAPFVAAVKRWEMIQPGDKIAVCISGGKDSMLLAKLIQMLLRYSDFPFEAEYLVMDPGYREENRKKIEENAKKLQIPITVFENHIFEVADESEKSPCYLCARMRRGALYTKAKALGCNKIALGHHLNDIIETTLMGMMYGGQIQGMLPRLKSTNFEGMELIRPMAEILETDIIRWRNYNGLDFIQCACRVTERTESGELQSKRYETKQWIKELKKVNPKVEINLFNSLQKVNVDTMIGYQLDGEMHSFLERFSD